MDDDDLHIRAQRHRQFVNAVKAITEPTHYTLADFRELAREYADEHHNEARLAIQQMTKEWLKWLAKREQGKEG